MWREGFEWRSLRCVRERVHTPKVKHLLRKTLSRAVSCSERRQLVLQRCIDWKQPSCAQLTYHVSLIFVTMQQVLESDPDWRGLCNAVQPCLLCAFLHSFVANNRHVPAAPRRQHSPHGQS